MKKQTEFEICKKACKEAGCYLPEENVFYSTIANTPMYVRAYFFLKGGILKGKMWGESNEI